MTGRRRRALTAAAVAALVAAGVAAAAGGGETTPSTVLTWDSKPMVARVPELRDDRVLVGRLRNGSPHPVRLDADAVRIVDERGRALRSTARFAAAFGHALYSPRDAPAEVSAQEDARLGRALTARPGQSVPVTLSWRLEGGRAPVAAEIAGARLDLPPGP